MVLKNLQKGFTLIEMMVVVAIMAAVSSMLIFNYSSFGALVKTRNVAQELALAIRKTQSFATSSAVLSDSSGNPIKDFGIVFSKDVNSTNYAPNSNSFLIFAAIADPFSTDQNTFGRRYVSSNNTCNKNQLSLNQECIEYFTIDKSVAYISDIGQSTDGGQTYSSLTGNVNVVFHRPVSDADMCVLSGGICSFSQNASTTRIIISSLDKKYNYTVTVWNTGQISVK